MAITFFKRAADLDADDVVAAVQAKEAAAELVLHQRDRARVGGGDHDRRGHALGHFRREARPRKHGHGACVADGLGQQFRHAQQRAFLEPLGRADDRRAAAADAAAPPSITCRSPCDGTATMMSSAPSSASAEIAGRRHRRRQLDARQVDGVLTPPLDLGRQRGVASPQPHAMAGERQMRGQRRAEAAGAQDRHLSHDVTRWPMRRSDPSRRRPMLERCRNTISAPTPAAVAVTAGEAPVVHASGLSASVARMEPSEM